MSVGPHETLTAIGRRRVPTSTWHSTLDSVISAALLPPRAPSWCHLPVPPPLQGAVAALVPPMGRTVVPQTMTRERLADEHPPPADGGNVLIAFP